MISLKITIYNHHYFSVLKIREHGGKHFISLRNPYWKHEWNGDCSDNSLLWEPELKKSIKLEIEKDLVRYFTHTKLSKQVIKQSFFHSIKIMRS